MEKCKALRSVSTLICISCIATFVIRTAPLRGGEPVWAKPTGSIANDFFTSYVMGSRPHADWEMTWESKYPYWCQGPLVNSDGTIFVGPTDSLHAVNPDGTLKWSYTRDHAYGMAVGFDGSVIGENGDYPQTCQHWTSAGEALPRKAVGGGPTIGPDGSVYGTYNVDRGRLRAINPDGGVRWSYPATREGRPSGLGPDGTVYFADRYVRAYTPAGTEKWRYDREGQHYYVPPTIGADGTVFNVHCVGGNAVALNQDGSLKWRRPIPCHDAYNFVSIGIDGAGNSYWYNGSYGIGSLDSSGTLRWSRHLWSNSSNKNKVPVMYADGTIVVAFFDTLCALSAVDGSDLWTYCFPSGTEVFGLAPGGDNVLYVSGNNPGEHMFLASLVSPTTVAVDVKPGSEENPVNLLAKGLLPVAILGSDTFDVADVDQSTLALDGASPLERGKSGKFGAFEDVDGDGYVDLMLRFAMSDLSFPPDATEAVLSGSLLDGTSILGSDAIRLITPGDANLDNLVDIQDFGILKAHFGQMTAAYGDGDFNEDGLVDTQDFGALKASFGKGAAAAASPAPEPASAALLLIGSGLMVLRHRKRRK